MKKKLKKDLPNIKYESYVNEVILYLVRLESSNNK